MNKPYILIVDDDKTLLQALPQALSLRIKDIAIDCADSAFAALLSDMNTFLMPSTIPARCCRGGSAAEYAVSVQMKSGA